MRARGRGPRRARAGGLWSIAHVLSLLTLWTTLGGCHAGLVRMSARGQHEAVVAAAGRARIPPRKKAARAWAASLVALGRAEEARAVLLRDFRRHAEVRSLVALADLEAAEGREGLAAAHYARALSLEVDVLRARADVCELLRRRAAQLHAEGEPLAADLDLRRVLIMCPKGQGAREDAQYQADRALHVEVAAAARRQARAQRTLAGCEAPEGSARGGCWTPSPEAVAEALARDLEQARGAGPGALRAAAWRTGAALPAAEVAGLLAAELRGDLGLDLVGLDELRGWIGDAPAVDVVAAAAALGSAIERDYARLRLAQLGPGYALPGDDAARSTASSVIRLLETFDADPGAAAMSWRVFALLGDLPSAELSLSSQLGGGARRNDRTGPKGQVEEPARGAGSPASARRGSKGEAVGAAQAGAAGAGGKGEGTGGKRQAPAGAGAGGRAGAGGEGEGTGGKRQAPAGAGAAGAGGEGEGTGGKGQAPAGAGAGGEGEGTGGKGQASAGAGAVGVERTGGKGQAPAGAGAAGQVAGGPADAGLKVEGTGGKGQATEEAGRVGPAGGPSGERAATGAVGAAEPPRVSPRRPTLWSARGEVDARTLPQLLSLARLRGLAGRRDQALEIATWALAEAEARGVPAVGELAEAEARHELAAGRPWAALALASVAPGSDAALQAAGTALVLERASCGERCGDADDRAAALQIFGEPWLVAQERRAADLAFAQARGAPRGACPPLAEWMAPDARGPLPEVLQRARREGLRAPGVPEGLVRAIEADLTLQCAGRVAAPLLYAADARVVTEGLLERLAHAPQEIGAGQLALQSELALVLGRRDAADQFLVAAAAAASEPRRVWRRAAALARLVDARHYELLASRQLLLHGPDAATAAETRLRLAVRALRDADDAWAPRNAEAGREALIRGIAEYLSAEPRALRWRAREELAFALAEYEWSDAIAAELVRAALWPDVATAAAHPAGLRRLERALGGPPDPNPPTPLAPREVAAWRSFQAGPQGQAAGAAGELSSAAAEALLGVDASEPARLAALRTAAAGPGRRRAAIAVAVTGRAAARREALGLLLADLAAEGRAAVIDAALARPSAVTGEGSAALIEGDEELLALAFGLARDPGRRRPEIKGQ